jgi:hypothetical protein
MFVLDLDRNVGLVLFLCPCSSTLPSISPPASSSEFLSLGKQSNFFLFWGCMEFGLDQREQMRRRAFHPPPTTEFYRAVADYVKRGPASPQEREREREREREKEREREREREREGSTRVRAIAN